MYLICKNVVVGGRRGGRSDPVQGRGQHGRRGPTCRQARSQGVLVHQAGTEAWEAGAHR